MGFEISYQPLFELKLFHGHDVHPLSSNNNEFESSEHQIIINDQTLQERYNYRDHFELTPTNSSKVLIDNQRLVVKETVHGVVVFTEVKKSGNRYIPSLPLDQNFILTFSIRIKNLLFPNYSEADSLVPVNGLFSFSNASNNSDNQTGFLYLNKPGNIYVSGEDAGIKIGPWHVENVSALGLHSARIVLYNPVIAREWIFQKQLQDSHLIECPLKLTDLPSGGYSLDVSSSQGNLKYSRSIVLDQGDILSNAYGIIQIYHMSDGSLGSLSLLDSDNTLLHPVYQLWWKNRKTFWRYKFNKEQLPADPGCDITYETQNGNEDKSTFVTKEILPLTNRLRKICYQPDNATFDKIFMPNPSSNLIYREGTIDYSDIYMGNLMLSQN